MVFTFESDKQWDGLDLYQSGNLILFLKDYRQYLQSEQQGSQSETHQKMTAH